MASALGVGVAGLALPVLATGTAHATGKQCDKVRIEYSLDGGKTWTTKGRMDEALVTKIQVRIAGDAQKGCDYAVSLASYSAEGPKWETSGKQKFLGWDTTKLSKSQKSATLDVTAYAPKCFGQVDLYGNGKKYDGNENPLPHYNDAPFPTNLITAWNGGKACEDTPTAPPTSTKPTQPPTDEGTKTPPPTDSTTTPPSDDDTKTPPPSGTPTTPSDDDTKTPPPATTQPAPGGGDSTPPVGTPEVPPMTEVANAELAETGGNDNTAVIIGSAAGALLVGGAGVLVWNRRRNAGGTPA
ncbi:LPXTG cell wall anchor domain-containing protein [Yinghuangia sp. ASG 101]|uniref:LPXTG cell wall anchor domain-containing protein n=1 Tax=Yinghuangia sp. ASG 101 TaxID=2896848 RepID=UPI001E605954|nr:LPXTG cell wall anchor domain-containing protein [Yinghuangia sp. ASG 101]UGQ10896.1 LPXTG cell wall anchor domain-containing protein [Yinghuangia sp. ASG 101]